MKRSALLRNAEFLKLWAGQTISVFGDQVTILALPLAAVLTLDASAFQMGLLTTLGWLPHLLFSLQAGVWLDHRGHRRAAMIAADLGRAVVLASVPVAYLLDVLSMPQLYVVAFLHGTLSVFFDLSSIASIGSVIALVVFTLITVGHVRVRRETGARLGVLLVALASTTTVLVAFVVTTLVDEPATAVLLAVILVLSVALDVWWKRTRDRRVPPVV